MSKRSRFSRCESFDHSNFPNKSRSANNPNKFFKPSSDNANVSTGMTIDMDESPKECFYCKSQLKKEDDLYIYRSLAFCKEECRAVQIAFDENVMKTRLNASNKKVDN